MSDEEPESAKKNAANRISIRRMERCFKLLSKRKHRRCYLFSRLMWSMTTGGTAAPGEIAMPPRLPCSQTQVSGGMDAFRSAGRLTDACVRRRSAIGASASAGVGLERNRMTGAMVRSPSAGFLPVACRVGQRSDVLSVARGVPHRFSSGRLHIPCCTPRSRRCGPLRHRE